MKICPHCRQLFEQHDLTFCPDDETRLVLWKDWEAAKGDPMLGRNVAGRFTIVGVIGEGGMGTVYRAIQAEIDRTVALKVLNRELAGSEMPVKRFRREARAVSLLSSPHTVRLYEFGQDDDGTLFLAMELLEGESLADRISRLGAMPWQEALKVGAQVAESLLEAHDNGVIHRDLKPENVYLAQGPGGKEIAKVLDFGLARLTQADQAPEIGLTHTGMVFGTPGYMSPEQAKGQRVDARSDVYSLGVVLYELLAGVLPFESEEAVLLMGQHISADVPQLAKRAPEVEVPKAVENLIRRMLIKDPEKRVQSAFELSEAIDSLLQGNVRDTQSLVQVVEPRTGQGDGLPEGRQRRWRYLFAAIAVLALVVGASFGVALAVPGLWRSQPVPPSDGRGTAPDAALSAPGSLDASREASPPSAEPQLVEIVVIASPVDARILLDGDLMKGNPYRGQHPRSTELHRIVVEADGYLTRERVLPFDRAREIPIFLEPASESSLVKTRPGKGTPSKGTDHPPTKKGGGGIDETPPW